MGKAATKTANGSKAPATGAEITYVRQEELQKIKALREQKAELDKKAKKVGKELGPLEEDVIRLMQAGVKIEEVDDGLEAEIKISERRTPAWKDLAIAFIDKLKGAGAGQKWADKAIEKTEPKPSIKLVIE